MRKPKEESHNELSLPDSKQHLSRATVRTPELVSGGLEEVREPPERPPEFVYVPWSFCFLLCGNGDNGGPLETSGVHLASI